MINKLTYTIFLLAAIVVLFTSCEQVVVRVVDIPPNSPTDQAVFITGNFNNWDPGDEKYRMQLQPDSSYIAVLPPGFGSLEYKFTRGDWTTVEKDLCGREIDNRSLILGESDTVINSIESWSDLDPVNCPRVTLVLSEIPRNTPKNDPISVAGNFNFWDPEESILQRDSAGKYFITIDRPPGISELEFKIFRGNLASAESDEYGNILPNRIIQFGKADTIEVNIDGWIDVREKKESSNVILIVKNFPLSTLQSDNLYFASSLSNWTAGDRNYMFLKDTRGNYFYSIPRKRKTLEYKITRGDWSSVEVDKFGFDISNRTLNLAEDDTIYIDIKGWKDKTKINDHEVTIILSSLPGTTPENPEIYVSGNFNDWAQRSKKYKFNRDEQGRYTVDIPRQRGVLEFKILRGSWTTIEVDKFGSEIPNRVENYQDVDVLYVDVANWCDLPTQKVTDVTLVLNSLPANTPKLEDIYLAPDFNGWDPGDRDMIFSKLSDYRFYITIPKNGHYFEFKITRGNWGNVEVDKHGNEIPDRVLHYGFADTVLIDVIKWRDFDGNY